MVITMVPVTCALDPHHESEPKVAEEQACLSVRCSGPESVVLNK